MAEHIKDIEETSKDQIEPQEEQTPVYEVNAQKMRKNLKVAIVALIVLVCAMAGCFYFLTVNSDNVSTQQAQTSNADVTNISSKTNLGEENQKSTSVPALTSLIGTNIDSAASAIGHGAEVSSDEARNDEASNIKRVVRYTLTSDGGDSKSGIPTVTANVGEDSNIISLDYSAATKALGYGTVSFRDALNNEHVVENTLKEAGVSVDVGVATLGDDVPASDYTTYASDGIKTTREERSFSGEDNGIQWSARLVYDYSIGNATDNLSDTVRTISISISR